jgi:hypothetical protein
MVDLAGESCGFALRRCAPPFWGRAPGGPSFASFGQHYAALDARFQIGAFVSNPWNEI